MNPMIPFAIVAALLLAAVLVVVLPPLLRRRAAASAGVDDEARSNLVLLREKLAELDAELAAGTLPEADHALARADIERRVLDEGVAAAPGAAAGRSPGAAIAVGLLVPLLAVALYARLGSPQALDPRSLEAAQAIVPAEVEAMIEQLAKRMQAQPTDPEGWALLGRSYAAMQRLPDALGALSRAVALRPDDAQLLADYADIMAAVHGQSLAGEPTKLIERALKIDPRNVKALALAGSAAFERRDMAAAIDFWGRARALVPEGSEFATGLDNSLAEARRVAGMPAAAPMTSAGTTPAAAPAVAATTPPTPAGAGPAAAAAGPTLRGRVQLSPVLAAGAQPDDTVFVYARAAEGPRVPLAILRRSVRDLPFDFALDDSMAMAPGMMLSRFGQVVVMARVSRSGQAITQSGDLIGESAPMPPGTQGVALTIDQRQP